VPDRQPNWPIFSTETLEWVTADEGYGPRTSRSAHRGPYAAAVPPRIADADLKIASSTVALVTEATAEIARFDGESLGSSTSYAALLLRSEAASSSQIENLTAGANAIAMAEIGRRQGANSTLIVANVAAMTEALELADHIDSAAILAMHRVLMGEHLPEAAGRWRSQPVWIGGSSRSPHGARYVAPRFELVPDAVEDLVSFIGRDDMPVLAQAAVSHAQFEAIHPFPDGNGRTGRALLHAQLRNGGLTRHSIVPVSAGLLGDTERYFDALDAYRAGDIDPVISEVATSVFPALANSRHLMNEVADIRTRWYEQLDARRGAAVWRLVDFVTTRPVVNTKLVAAHLGVSTANAQGAIDRLVELGALQQVGNGQRSRVWRAGEVIEAMDAFAARAHRRAG
jgi:Fic family protein